MARKTNSLCFAFIFYLFLSLSPSPFLSISSLPFFLSMPTSPVCVLTENDVAIDVKNKVFQRCVMYFKYKNKTIESVVSAISIC